MELFLCITVRSKHDLGYNLSWGLAFLMQNQDSPSDLIIIKCCNNKHGGHEKYFPMRHKIIKDLDYLIKNNKGSG